MNKKLNYFFLFSMAFISLFHFALHHTFVFSGEPIQEGATILFSNAYFNSKWKQNIWTTDTGYLVWLPMAISVFLVKVFGIVKNFFIYSQIISVFFIAFFASMLCLNSFRNLISSNFARFLIALYIGIFVYGSTLEFVLFNNFAYTGISFALLLPFMDKERLGYPTLLFLSTIAMLLLASKAYFIIFLPLYIAFGLVAVIRKEFKSFIFFGISSFGLVIQTLQVLSGYSAVGKQAYSIADLLLNIVLYYLSSVAGMLDFLPNLGLSHSGAVPPTLAYSAIFLCVLALCFYIWKTDRRLFVFFLFTQFVAIASIGITLKYYYSSGLYPIFSATSMLSIFPIPNVRHFIFSNVAIILGFFPLILSFPWVRKHQVLVTSLVLALMLLATSHGNGFHIFQQEDDMPPEMRLSNWKLFHSLLDNQEVFIPGDINFQHIFILKGAVRQLNDVGLYNQSTNVPLDTPLINEYLLSKHQQKTWILNGFILFPEVSLGDYYQTNSPLYGSIINGGRISQKFTAKNNGLRGISLQIKKPDNEALEKWKITVVDDNSNLLIYSVIHELYSPHDWKKQFISGGYSNPLLNIEWKPLLKSAGKQFTITIERNNSNVNAGFKIMSAATLRLNGTLSIDGQVQKDQWLPIKQKYGRTLAIAYDKLGRPIARGTLISPLSSRFSYFLFEKPVTHVEKIQFQDETGAKKFIHPRIMFFGKTDET